jgi:hypothetical protein
MFLVGSGRRDKEHGHVEAVKSNAIAGGCFLLSLFVFNFLFPADFDIHPSHYADSFLMATFASQLSFTSALVLYFDHSRIEF